MRFQPLFVFLVLLTSFSNAQNLVPNPSFEDTIGCPTNGNQISKAKFWSNPTNASPDYFNSCSTASGGIIHVPNNGFGFQTPASGNAYAGLYAYNPSSREYIESPLSIPLTMGHKYLVSFYVSLAEISQYAVSSIGALISNSPISGATTGVLSYTPQIQNTQSNVLSDKINWTLIQDTLLSNGSEQYITIGNFKTDALSDTTYLGNSGGNNLAYYFIDDISVIDVQDLGVNEAVSINFKVFPNPANSTLNVEARLQDAEIGIYDMLGDELLNEKLNYKKQIDISSFPNGIYLARILDIQRSLICLKKVIIQH